MTQPDSHRAGRPARADRGSRPLRASGTAAAHGAGAAAAPATRVDGVLVVDKPQGVTSHDVVAAARRALGERRIGHTGTLDPLATGVLPLACGRATRLVRFLAPVGKEYEAVIRFGLTTDSYDVTGVEVSRSEHTPSREDVERALTRLRGEYDQTPPAFSAKHVAGGRAYDLARRAEPVELAPVRVRVTRAELVAFTGQTATVSIEASSGFYVRTFAHSLGSLVGSGACLEALRRTRSGEFGLAQAVTLDDLVTRPDVARARLTGLDALLPWMPAARVTAEGRRRVAHGQPLVAAHLEGPPDVPQQQAAGADPAVESPDLEAGSWVRLLDAEGHLTALAKRKDRAGALHPAVVLI